MSAAASLRIDVLTLFPGLFDGFLGESILKRAIDKGLVEVQRWDIRDWAEGKHKQVDDRPFGGGPGMVLMAPPVVAAVEAVRALAERPGPPDRPDARRGGGSTRPGSASWPREPRLVLLCGRYEGFDERIIEIARARAAVDRRLRPLRRRGRGHGRDRRRDAAGPRRPGRRRERRRRVVRPRRRPGISPVHPPPRVPRDGRSPKSSSAATTPRSPAGAASIGADGRDPARDP